MGKDIRDPTGMYDDEFVKKAFVLDLNQQKLDKTSKRVQRYRVG